MLLRLISWTVLKIGKQTLILWTLLSLVLGSLVFGLADLVRGLDLQLMISISLIGMLAGWLFARTRMSGPAAALLSIALGVAMILIRIGRLGGPLVRLVFALNEMVAGYLNWRPLLPFPVSMTARLGLLELWNSIAAMFVHIRDWAAALGSSSAFDPVATNLVWNFAIWSIAVWAAWAIRKLERPLPAVTPAGVLLAASLAFTRESTGLLLLVLPATFILMAWVHYRVQERRWETSQVDYSEDIRLDLGIVVCVLTTLLVLAAAYSPIVSIRRIIDFTSRLARPADNLSQPIGRSLGLEPGRSPVEHSSLADMRSGGLPRDHLLGSGPELSRDVVMLIHTGDIPPGPPEMVLRRPLPRYYWRSITYDRYTGRGWATGPTETIAYRADQPALATDLPARRLVNQTVEFMGALAGDFQDRLLYTAGELVSVDQDYQVAWRTRSAGKETASEGDIFGATTTAKKYQVDSLVSMPTQDQLRSAGQEYPEWVRSRFLALPEDLPSRVLSLARDLAATNPTPYDRALAIEAHLRSYTYNLELPAPPSNRDIVDYFLFDIKEGYCDYYATAMVVLSRAAGIPARMAIGYASGSYDAYNARYVVTEAEAHSWPEIYFPGYGWVIFEPTAGQPPLARQGEAGLLSTPGLESGGPTPAFRLPVAWPRILGWAGLLVAISALLAVSWVLSEHWRLGKLSPSGTIAVLYGRIYRRGRGLEVPATAGSTPYEFATLFSERLIELGHNKNREQVLLPAAREVHQIADLYAQAIYSQHAPCTSQQQQAIQIWQRLRWRLWLAKLGGQDRKQS